MTKRIFRSICLVALAVFFSSVVLIMGVLYNYFSDVRLNQLKMQTGLAAKGVEDDGAKYFDGLDLKNLRITWIDAEGKILYDNQADSAMMENHLERTEIRQALASGYGQSRRYSATLMERSLYAAQRLSDGSVLRLSVSQSSVLLLLLGMSQPILIVFAAALVLSVILAVRLSNKVVTPLNELDLDNPMENDNYEELSPLLRRIASQQQQMKLQEEKLLEKQEELGAVIRNMREGMILLNPDGKVLSINPAAASLLGTDTHCTGTDILTVSRSLDLQEAISKAFAGRHAEKAIRINGSRYQMDASPIITDGAVSGAALLFFDVTEKEKSEQMRREFTANVSHELKTPLHSILGHAELIKNGMVKKEDICPFAEKIYDEAQRMVQLVEDIMSLSRLDEGAQDMQRESADLYEMAKNVIKSLEQEAAGAGISLVLSGGTASINGIPPLLYGIVLNLCENAVKYNHKDGSVSVLVEDHASEAVLSVEDTGIGIPAEHQEHIFERFYRVDKSHSKERGGTGLGLSIVKHAAIIHHAKISMRSVPGKGTKITVRFPKQKGA